VPKFATSCDWNGQTRADWFVRGFEHKGHQNQTLIWLLRSSTKKVVTADYPGRVLELKQRSELNKLLNMK